MKKETQEVKKFYVKVFIKYKHNDPASLNRVMKV